MNLFKKIGIAVVGMAMAVGVGVAVNSGRDAVTVHAAAPTSWVQCADVSDFAAGDSIIIATNDSTKYFNGATKSGPHWDATALSASSPASNTAAGVIVLGSTGTANKYYLKLAGGTNKDKYVTASKAASKGSAISDSDSNGWTFTKSSTNYFELNYAGNNAKFCSYNNSDFRSYGSYSNGQQVTIYKYSARTLSSISVSVAPTKTSYVVGEYFNPTGLIITRTFSSGDPDTYSYANHTSEFGFSPSLSTALTEGDTSVTITYGGKSTSLAINVTAPKTPGSLASVGQTTSFETGGKFAYGGTLTVTYTDSTNKTVSPESFKIGDAEIDPTSSGTTIVPGTTVLNRNDHHGKTVYVLYTENATTVYASYTISVAAISSVTFTGGTDTGTASGSGQSDTITKNGVSMSCDSCYTASGAYRFYNGSTLTISSTIGNIAKIEFNMNGSYNSNLFSTSTGTYNCDDSSKGVWTGESASIEFDLSAQARCDSVVVTLASNDPLVEVDASSAEEVEMFKGDSNNSIKVLVKNIDSKVWTYTFDEGGNTGLQTSSYINVSAGAAVNNVHTLTITAKAVGSTTLHISVSGTSCESAIPVTVNAKPVAGTMVAKLNSVVVEDVVEIQTGHYKQFTFAAEDTDGNAYAIAASDVTGEKQSGTATLTISGTRVTGASVGTAVVRYSLNVLTSVYVDIEIEVKNDYLVSVNSVTFNTGLEAVQGTSPSEAIFATRVGNTYFGSTDTIPLEDFRFSYSDELGVTADQFGYDFSHGSTVDSTHKSQTIYVYCTLGNVKAGTYTVVVEQLDDPLTAITITNVTSNAKTIARGDSFQLTIEYTPENPTDGKEVVYRVDSADSGVDVSVNSTGLISVSDSSGLGDALVVVESAHDDSINDFVVVTVVLESMSYTIDEEESWTLVTDPSKLLAGDQIIIADANSEYGLGAYVSGNNCPGKEITSDGSAISSIGNASPLTLSNASSGKFYLYDGNSYLYAASSSGNQLKGKNSTDSTNGAWEFTYSSGHMNIIASDSSNRNVMQFNPNNGNPIFNCYASASQTALQVYKRSGGESPVTVTETLFNAIHNNFGAGKTYAWSESCEVFNSSAWESAGSALTGIANFSSYKLNRAVANANGNEVEQFLAKYDFIISKSVLHATDFLHRFDNGGIMAGERIVNPMNNALSENNATASTIIITVISVVSLAAVAGYFFYRTRKEQ